MEKPLSATLHNIFFKFISTSDTDVVSTLCPMLKIQRRSLNKLYNISDCWSRDMLNFDFI